MSDFEKNKEKVSELLDRFSKTGVLNHINGESVPAISGDTFENISPIDLKVVCKVARSNSRDVNTAVDAANKAFFEWASLPGQERKKILHCIADGIEKRSEEIALIEAVDTGQSLRFMSKAALRGAANFRFFADQAPSGKDGESTFANSQTNITMRYPIGPVGIITPWNTPFMLSTWKIAPALAAGCTVVHKPAEFSPLTAKILIEIAEEAGLPNGVWNTINGYGEEAGKFLTEHPDIKAVSFVGESATGSMIMRQGAETLKRVHFELGGKNAVVVFEDADLERAADAVVFMIYSLNGERCTSSSRLLIEDSVKEKFVQMVLKKAERIKVGHPLDPNTTVGPLIHPIHEEKVKEYLEIGIKEGATLLTGGSVDGPGGGPYVAPTIFTDVTREMQIAREEIFGPVLVVIPFQSDKEALEIANETEYGLAGYLWTNDVTRAFQFSQSMEAGMIWVNSENVRHLPTPFGGVKSSGIGRDGGDWSFDFYMETKNISFATTEHKIPKLGG